MRVRDRKWRHQSFTPVGSCSSVDPRALLWAHISNSSNLHFFNTTTEDYTYTYLLYEATPTNCAVVCEAYTVQMHIPIKTRNICSRVLEWPWQLFWNSSRGLESVTMCAASPWPRPSFVIYSSLHMGEPGNKVILSPIPFIDWMGTSSARLRKGNGLSLVS